MADFRLRKQAQSWFKHIADTHPFKYKFDIFYLCLLLGVSARRSSKPTDGDSAPGFVDEFVGEYKTQSMIIIALLLRLEIARMGIELDDRAGVRGVLSEFLGIADVNSAGVNRLNEYASGGFDVLQEKYGDEAPRTPEEFFPRYLEILYSEVNTSDLWS